MAAPVTKKTYGLIKSKQTQPATSGFVPRLSVFGEDSSSEDEIKGEAGLDRKAFLRATEQSVQKKQTKLDMQRALEQDPTIYEYDQVYDEIAEKRSESKKAKQDVDRKPKYIASLLAQSERRKREYERRTERMVQKEREAEGEEFKDKEAFVTASYRAKLEEFTKQDEEEEYRDKLEAFTEVSKQRDLGGFYRHIYRQTVAEGDSTDSKTPVERLTESAPTPDEHAPTPVKPAPTPVEPALTPVEPALTPVPPETIASTPMLRTPGEKRKRQYRPRQESGEDSDSNLSDSSSASSENIVSNKSVKIEPIESVVPDSSDSKVVEIQLVEKHSRGTEISESVTVEEEIEVKKPKVNIWLKRTVGSAFDAALRRYYIRKGMKC